MTTSAITTKLSNLKDRADRLRQFGALGDGTQYMLDDALSKMDHKLDMLDQHLVEKLAVAEGFALQQLSFAGI